MPRGYLPYPYAPYHPFAGMEAANSKYDLAWGGDRDMQARVQPFKSGELPPATPDPSAMFKEGGFFGRSLRSQMIHPSKEMFYG